MKIHGKWAGLDARLARALVVIVILAPLAGGFETSSDPGANTQTDSVQAVDSTPPIEGAQAAGSTGLIHNVPAADSMTLRRMRLQGARVEWRRIRSLDSVMWTKMTAAKRRDKSDSQLVRERDERNRRLLKMFCTDSMKIVDAAEVDSLNEMKSDEKSLCKAEFDSSKVVSVSGEE